MSKYILFDAEEGDEEEKHLTRLLQTSDNLLSESDNSQSRVFGTASSDESSEYGEYDADFIDDQTPPNTPRKRFRLSLTDIHPTGLPDNIAKQLPSTSALWEFVRKADHKLRQNLLGTTMVRKGKAPLKFQEKAEASTNQTSMTSLVAAKVDKFLEAKLNKKLQGSQKAANKQKALRAMQVAAEQIETVDSGDEDDEGLESGFYSGTSMY